MQSRRSSAPENSTPNVHFRVTPRSRSTLSVVACRDMRCRRRARSQEAEGVWLMGLDQVSSRVLEYIIAHGGLERWRAIDEMVLSASVGGASLSVKHQGKAIRNLEAHISPGRQRVVFVPYPEPGERGVFEEGAVRIESDRGEIVAERPDARSAFRGFRHQLWWDKLDVLYFCGYALWTYLTIPFVLTEPGFEVRELEPWTEGGEIWQRIAVRFPSEIHTHCREQVLYFDQKGLVRRHDYTSEVFGAWAKAAHYPFDHQTFDGVILPMRRRVFFRRRDNHPFTAVTLVWLDIETVRLVPRNADEGREVSG